MIRHDFPLDADGPGPDPTPEDLEAAAAEIERHVSETMRLDYLRSTRLLIERARRDGLTPAQLAYLIGKAFG